jgi:hypothetical protein
MQLCFLKIIHICTENVTQMWPGINSLSFTAINCKNQRCAAIAELKEDYI